MTTEGAALIFIDGRGRWVAPGGDGYPTGGDGPTGPTGPAGPTGPTGPAGSEAAAKHAWLTWLDGPSDPLPDGTFIEFGNSHNTGPLVVQHATDAISLDVDGFTIRFVEAGSYHVRIAVQFSNVTVTQARVASYITASTTALFDGFVAGDPDPETKAVTTGFNEDQVFNFDWTVDADANFTVGVMLVGDEIALDGIEVDIVKYGGT